MPPGAEPEVDVAAADLAEHVWATLRDARARVAADATLDRARVAQTIAWQLTAPQLVSGEADPTEASLRLALIVWAVLHADLAAVRPGPCAAAARWTDP